LPSKATGQAIFEHFDSSSWIVVPGPQTSDHISISSLAASSGDDVWAVGSQRGFGRRAPTLQLIEHFNGSSWTIVPGARGRDWDRRPPEHGHAPLAQ